MERVAYRTNARPVSLYRVLNIGYISLFLTKTKQKYIEQEGEDKIDIRSIFRYLIEDDDKDQLETHGNEANMVFKRMIHLARSVFLIRLYN